MPNDCCCVNPCCWAPSVLLQMLLVLSKRLEVPRGGRKPSQQLYSPFFHVLLSLLRLYWLLKALNSVPRSRRGSLTDRPACKRNSSELRSMNVQGLLIPA